MGRAKVKIQRLEKQNKRQTTYSKRRTGIVKKAKELSILCDVDLALILFSPNGKPTMCLGEHSNIDEMIAKFAQISSEERAKRKLKALNTLKGTFKKLDHELKVEDYFGVGSQEIKNLCEESKALQTQLKEKTQKFSHDWQHIDSITDLDQLISMQHSLQNSLYQIRVHKFQNGMQMPLSIHGNQNSQQMIWQLSNDLGQPFLSQNMEQLLPRNIDCFVDNSIPPSNDSLLYFNTEGQMDLGTKQNMATLKGLDPKAYPGPTLG